MKLVYKATQKPVNVGDTAITARGDQVIVDYFRPPHKPSSEGHVSIKSANNPSVREYYVSVIGAEWIDREDRR